MLQLWKALTHLARNPGVIDACQAVAAEEDVPNPVATQECAEAQSPRFRAMPRDVMIKTYRAHADLYDEIQDKCPSVAEDEIETIVCAEMKGALMAVHQVIDRRHAVSRVEQMLGQDRSQVAGCACDKYAKCHLVESCLLTHSGLCTSLRARPRQNHSSRQN